MKCSNYRPISVIPFLQILSFKESAGANQSDPEESLNRSSISQSSYPQQGIKRKYRNSGTLLSQKFIFTTEKYPQNAGLGENVPNTTEVYRKVLSNQPDKSVVIVTVGYLTNLSKLLNSGPDNISPLTGAQLIKQKVKHYVCMGGRYPLEQNPGKWGNFKPDPEAVQHVTEEWPTQIIFTTGGAFADAIPTGKILFTDRVERENPVSKAYEIFLNGKYRTYHHSADLNAVCVAVKGHFHIFEDGTHMWRFGPNNLKHHIISDFAEGVDPLEVASDFDELLVK